MKAFKTHTPLHILLFRKTMYFPLLNFSDFAKIIENLSFSYYFYMCFISKSLP